jgi:hypothetical protein
MRSVRPTPPASPVNHHPAAAWIKRQLSTANYYLCHSAAKTTAMFSTTYSLFFRHLSAPILCCQHLPASFLQNRGVGYTHASKIFWCQLFALSAMFSAKYELFALFFQRRPFVFITL